jgi:hypothetical protein
MPSNFYPRIFSERILKMNMNNATESAIEIPTIKNILSSSAESLALKPGDTIEAADLTVGILRKAWTVEAGRYAISSIAVAIPEVVVGDFWPAPSTDDESYKSMLALNKGEEILKDNLGYEFIRNEFASVPGSTFNLEYLGARVKPVTPK